MPRPGGGGEDDGWVLATVFRAGSMTTDLVILDAARLSAGPLATLRLPFHIPIGAQAPACPQWSGDLLDYYYSWTGPRHGPGMHGFCKRAGGVHARQMTSTWSRTA